jgi:peptidoglycan/xylan/chitin deacetylase (PgdA/CDA1 family)
MNDNGFDFGSHSCNHPYLTRMTENEILTEVLKSKYIIEDRINKSVKFFCYPYGDSDKRTQQIVKSCGYLGAFGGVDFSLGSKKKNLYDLKRMGTSHFSSIQDFQAGLLGTYQWYIKVRNLAGKA